MKDAAYISRPVAPWRLSARGLYHLVTAPVQHPEGGLAERRKEANQPQPAPPEPSTNSAFKSRANLFFCSAMPSFLSTIRLEIKIQRKDEETASDVAGNRPCEEPFKLKQCHSIFCVKHVQSTLPVSSKLNSKVFDPHS